MERWSKEKADRWWREQPWPLGYNFVPTYAVNDVEFWMDDTFDLAQIRKDLHVGEEVGYNSVRVFLPYIVWQHEGTVFERNFDAFLQAAADAGMRVVPVLFDDCAFDGGADPVYGRQPEPCTGKNLGRWVPSPGFAVQDDPAALEGCRDYVRAVICPHKDDARVLCWDLYNEPGNTERYGKAVPLLRRAFAWARECEPSQPLTVGPWLPIPELEEITRICFEESDVISLHIYDSAANFRGRLEPGASLGRPVLVTEWYNRPANSFPQDQLPYFYEHRIGCWQWGLIAGRGNDNYSPVKRADGSMLWQHDLFDSDGNVYDEEELRTVRTYAAKLK